MRDSFNFDEIKNAPEFPRFARAALAVAALWLAFALVFVFAAAAKNKNSANYAEASRILSAATEIKSYPERGAAAAAEPLSAVSAILDKTRLREKTAQLSSSPTGLALQVNRLHPEEFESLASEIRASGLAVRTAEVRALSSRSDGRLLNVTLTIEGESE